MVKLSKLKQAETEVEMEMSRSSRWKEVEVEVEEVLVVDEAVVGVDNNLTQKPI